MCDQFLYSHNKTTYFVSILYKENMDVDKLTGVERVNSDYHFYPCIMHTFLSQSLPLKSRCALYMAPFVFIFIR